MKESIFNTFRWVQVPYVKNGCSFAGVDCLGLITLVLQVEAGVGVPDCKANDYAEAESFFTYFEKVNVENMQQFDVLAMSHRTTGSDHCGIVIGENSMLHALSGHGVTVGKISTWKSRIEGVYRHKDMI